MGLDTVQVLHDHLTASLCQTVFRQTRTTERERHWTLHALAKFWTAVILRAPHSLTQDLEEAAAGTGTGWPPVQVTPEAFFERCQDLHWRFFANLHDAFVTQVLPEALPCYAAPLHPLRERFAEVWWWTGRVWTRLPIGSSCCVMCARRCCPVALPLSMICTVGLSGIWPSTRMQRQASCPVPRRRWPKSPKAP